MTEWHEFRDKRFEEICTSCPHESKVFIENGKAFVSHGFDDERKSQIALAFVPEPINTFLDKKSGAIKVESTGTAGLCFELDPNGEVSSFILDFKENKFPLKKFTSAGKIEESLVIKFINYLPLVFRATHPLETPRVIEKILWMKFKYWNAKSITEIILSMAHAVPILGKVLRSLSGKLD